MSKRHVWVDNELADLIENLKDTVSVDAIISGYFEASRDNLEDEVKAMDEALVQYKGYMISAKKAYEEAMEVALEESYQLWLNFDEKLPSITKKTSEVRGLLSPVLEDLKETNRILDSLNLYKLESLIELVDKISRLDGRSAKMVEFLFEQYKSD